jgi:hypothetical protein
LVHLPLPLPLRHVPLLLTLVLLQQLVLLP